MKRIILILILPLAIIFLAFALKEDDMDRAYVNAKKGAQWGLANLKIKKTRMENRLISDDKLLSVVKVEKEINGIKITSTGFDGSTEVSVTAYRTFETLLKEGYIDKNFIPRDED